MNRFQQRHAQRADHRHGSAAAAGSSIYAEFYKKATGRDTAQVKAIWSRILFTGRGVPPKQLLYSTAVKRAVAANPKAVGYIEKSAVDPSVKVILPLS